LIFAYFLQEKNLEEKEGEKRPISTKTEIRTQMKYYKFWQTQKQKKGKNG
jgi:hypothetical protein